MELKVKQWVGLNIAMQDICGVTFLEPDIAFKLDDYRQFATRVHKMAIERKEDSSFLEKEATCDVEPFDFTFEQFRTAIREQWREARENRDVEFTPKWLDPLRILFKDGLEDVEIE